MCTRRWGTAACFYWRKHGSTAMFQIRHTRLAACYSTGLTGVSCQGRLGEVDSACNSIKVGVPIVLLLSLTALKLIKCRPYYLPRELTAVFIVVVYIPLSAKASEAQGELHENICSLQNNHPDAFNVIAGDFNNVNLMDITPRFYQYVTIVTGGNNTLDRV